LTYPSFWVGQNLECVRLSFLDVSERYFFSKWIRWPPWHWITRYDRRARGSYLNSNGRHPPKVRSVPFFFNALSDTPLPPRIWRRCSKALDSTSHFPFFWGPQHYPLRACESLHQGDTKHHPRSGVAESEDREPYCRFSHSWIAPECSFFLLVRCVCYFLVHLPISASAF